MPFEFNEDQFIEYISKHFPSKDSCKGIGDDCAVIPQADGKAWLVTTDALVEGVHFLKDQIPANDLGYKTIAVNISDIAAMGGIPQYAFLSLALPKTIERSWVDLFINGIKEACNRWNILLLGGDTVGSKRDLFINLTLIGSAAQSNIKYRNRAQAGDIICVNGYLGDSGAGLKALQSGIAKTNDIQHLINAHFRPKPSPEEGQWLASYQEVHAMMDTSDGIDCDLRRLLKSSKKGATIEIEQLPISPTLSKASLEQNWDPLQLALMGGEDYRLLLTVSSEKFDGLQQAFQNHFHNSLIAIGHVNDHTNELSYHKNGKPFQINYKSYNHFQ